MGKTVPSGELWGGVPAAKVRDLTEAEKAAVALTVSESEEWALLHASELQKSWEEIAEEDYDRDQTVNRNEYYYKRLTKEQMAFKLGEVEAHMVPGRILNSPVSVRQSESQAAVLPPSPKP